MSLRPSRPGASTPARPTHRTSLRFLGLLTALLTAHAPVRADDPIALGLAGNDDILWSYQRSPEPDGTLLLRFAYRPRDARPPLLYFPLGLPPVVGGVRHAVALERHLHVIYRDGTHKRYRPSSYISDPWSTSLQSNERTLPHSETPLLLAADRTARVLYAVVSARAAVALAAASPEEARLPPDEPTVVATTAPIPSTATAVARFAEGLWTLDRPGPTSWDRPVGTGTMLARNSAIHLVYPDENGRLVYTVSEAADTPWTAPVPLPLSELPVAMFACWLDDHPALLFAVRADARLRVAALPLNNPNSTGATILLRDAGGKPQDFAHPLGLGAFGVQLAVLSLDAEGRAQVGLWSATDGHPVEAATPVTPLNRRNPSPTGGVGSVLLQYALLAALLAGIFIWRRDSVVLTLPMVRSRRLAPLTPRFAAALIDLTLLFPVWGPLMFVMVLSDFSRSFSVLMLPPRDVASSAAWFWPVLGGVYALYGFILEGLFGATLGKRITGLMVVDFRGRRCRLAVILVRNLARILEFHFAPLVLLVFFTPARQRVGDILAQTIVVTAETVPDDPETPPPPNASVS